MKRRLRKLSILLFIAAWMVTESATAAEAVTVYIARRGWHIDIGLRRADLAAPLDSVATELPDARYVFFGFGDQHYLLAKNHHAPAMLSALWPGGGIILVTGLAGSPDQGFGAAHVIAASLNAEQISALRAFIWRSFESHNDTVNVYRQGPYEGSLHFLAATKYSAFHTCNTWAAQALRAAGLRVHSGGVVFASQLWSQVRRLPRGSDSADQQGGRD